MIGYRYLISSARSQKYIAVLWCETLKRPGKDGGFSLYSCLFTVRFFLDISCLKTEEYKWG